MRSAADNNRKWMTPFSTLPFSCGDADCKPGARSSIGGGDRGRRYRNHGHWSTGAEPVISDGKAIVKDECRDGGIHANAAMWVDPNLKNTV